jgi:hypothetical protein
MAVHPHVQNDSAHGRASRRWLTAVGVAALALTAVVGSGVHESPVARAGVASTSAPNTALPAGTYCNQTPTPPTAAGTAVSPADYNGPTKVLQIFEENESSSVVDADDTDAANFMLNTLGGQCGVLTNMHGETHPSETNYLDDVNGGNNPNWTLCDGPPNSTVAGCPYSPTSTLTSPSIFSQSESKSGATARRTYGQSQSMNCQQTDGPGGLFGVRHSPAQYFAGINCAGNAIPSGDWQNRVGQFYSDVVTGSLPAFSMYTPNNTDNGHDPTSYNPASVNISNLDTALSKLMALIQSGKDYQSGKLIVMVTFDEGTTTGKAPFTDASTGEDCANRTQGNSQPSCQILSYVAGRYVPWQSDSEFTTHYSMLKTTQQILGLTPQQGYSYLGHAGDMLTNDFYYQFKLAPNSWSTGPVITPSPPTVASAPTGVTATPGAGTATISFNAPGSSGGSSISSYTVTSSPGGLTATGTRSPLTVTGLTGGTGYTFTVTATNKFGAGAASAPSAAVTPSAAAGGTQLLSDPGFEAGNSGWTPFTVGTLTRVVSPVRGGAFGLQVASPNAGPGLVGLTNTAVVTSSTAGQNYVASCYVRPSAAGLASTVRILEYTPNYTSYVQLGQTVVTSLPVGGWTLVQVSGIAARSGERIIPQIYSTNQTASNGVLVYDDCSVTGAAKQATVPTAPTSVTATPGNGKAVVTFTAPVPNGVAVTGYTVTSTPGNIVTTGATSPITVSGLSNGTAYTFTVVASSAAGAGALSAPSASVRPSVELLPDAGFETGNGGFSAFLVGTLSRVTSPVHGGGNALKVVSPNATPGLVGLTQTSAVTNSVAGRTYTFSCFVLPSAANLSVTTRMLEYSQDFATHDHLDQITAAPLAVGTWTKVSVSSVATRSGDRMVPQVYSTNQSSANGSLTYDDCSLSGS